MTLHFLISISSETENLFGVRFLCSFMKPFADCEVTLFHLGQDNRSNSSASLLNMWQNPSEDEAIIPHASARRAMNHAMKMLQASNFCKESLQTKATREKYGKIRDILFEASNGLYDAMILGRRASYALQWMFERPADEIPQAMIRNAALSSPMWLCSSPEESRQNVLLCVDDSPGALRIADHVGYILSFVPHHHVTLFHVANPMGKADDEIFRKATEMLLLHNIQPERIHTKMATGISVVNTILNEESNNRHAVVAVGLNRQSSKNILGSSKGVGKTTSALVSKLQNASLWCCP